MRLKIFQKYVISIYLKNFFIVFFGLQLFYLGIDLMQNLKKVADSANLQILYSLYTFFTAINITLPISLVFAMIITKFYLIRSSELIALYALGVSKKDMIKPIFLSSLFLTIIYVSLNFTNFAYSKEYAHNILSNSSLSNISSDLFLKYYDKYIYIKKLNPIEKRAVGVKIFDIKDGDLRSISKAKSADFVEDYWVLNDISIINKPDLKSDDAKLTKSHFDHYKTLKGFKPKIIENVYKHKTDFSILDALNAIDLFLSQNVNIQKIKASLFSMLFFPFFAPLLNVILFYYMPISNRFFNMAFIGSLFLFVSLITWALLFMLIKMSLNSVISAEFGIVFPILILSFIAYLLYSKNR